MHKFLKTSSYVRNSTKSKYKFLHYIKANNEVSIFDKIITYRIFSYVSKIILVTTSIKSKKSFSQ